MGVIVAAKLSFEAQDLLRRIGFPESLPAGCQSFTLIETHLSVVIIGGEFTLKWKKPAQYSFIDHRDILVRRQSIISELTLNQRHSTGVYLGVAVAKDSQIELNPNIPSQLRSDDTEWGVWMKTLPKEQFLSYQIESDIASADSLIKVAEQLALFHNRQRIHPVLKEGADYVKMVEAHCADNIETLSNACDHLSEHTEDVKIALLKSYQKILTQNRELLAQRPAHRWIIDGHGDLRAEHISFQTVPCSFIDCIEFSAEYRELDMLDELAFLAMDLRRRHCSDLSAILIKRYCELVPDAYLPNLFSFYCYYRATVRAKIEYLTWLQRKVSDPRATPLWQEPLRLAVSIAAGYAGPHVIAIAGLMGIGKSTLAQALLTQLYAVYLQADEIRHEIFGKGDRESPFSTGLYSNQNRDLVYQQLTARALRHAKRGEIVIVDASFMRSEHRRKLADECRNNNFPFNLILCSLDRESTLARLEARSALGNSRSDGRRELYDHQRNSFEPTQAAEQIFLQELDMSKPVVENVATTLALLISN